MRRPIASCACVLALITGAWVGQAYTPLGPPDPLGAVETSAQGATATAWRFYDAIDLLLRTGDDGALHEVIAPNFVDHVHTPTATSGRDALLGYLADLRTSHPALHLVPRDLIAQDDRAVAQVTIAGGGDGTVLGMPLGGLPPWPAVETVRIADGRIVERWGSPAGYALATLVFSEAMTVPSRGAVLPYLRRVTLAPGANDARLDRVDPAIVVVESGELAVGTDDGGSEATPAANQRLGRGSTLAIPEDMDVELNNRSDAPAVFLLFSLAQPNQAARPGLDTNLMEAIDGIEVQRLAGYETVEVFTSTGGLMAEMAQVTLAPGVALASHPIEGVELMSIEDGTLTLTADGALPTAWLLGPTGRSVFPGQYAELPQGYGLSISGNVDAEGDVRTSYRNETDHPVTFLLLRLAPG